MTPNILLIQPYLFFDGRCEQAIEFYKSALGAEVQFLMRYNENPEPQQPGCAPVPGEKIMHAQIRIGQTVVFLSDGQNNGKPNFDGFSLSATVPAEADADRVFNALANGGEAVMPLAKTFFSARFGMVKDRFGVMWMVIVTPQGHPQK